MAEAQVGVTKERVSGALSLEEFVTLVPDSEYVDGGDNYCLDLQGESAARPTPALFYPGSVHRNQIPLGAAAISQVTSALEAHCPSKLVRCDDRPNLSSSSERQSKFHETGGPQDRRGSLISFGSFDIVDTDDLEAAGIQPPLSNGQCESVLIQRLKLVSRENSEEDYLLLINPQQGVEGSGKGETRPHPQSPPPSGLLSSTSHDPHKVLMSCIEGTGWCDESQEDSIRTVVGTADDSLLVAGVDLDTAPTPTSTSAPICRLSPQSSLVSTPHGCESSVGYPAAHQSLPAYWNGTHKLNSVKNRGVEIGTKDSTRTSDISSLPHNVLTTTEDQAQSIPAANSVGKSDQTTPTMSQMKHSVFSPHLDSTVEKDSASRHVNGVTPSGRTAPPLSGPTVGVPTHNSRTSVERDGFVLIDTPKPAGEDSSAGKVRNVVNYYEQKLQEGSANSSSAVKQQGRDSSPPSIHGKRSPSPCRQGSYPLDRSRIEFFERQARNEAAGAGTSPVYMKKKSSCNILRAYSEPTQSDFLTADQLIEIPIHMSGTQSLPRSPQSNSLQPLRPSRSPANSPQPSGSSQSQAKKLEPVNFKIAPDLPSEQEIMECIEAHCNEFINYTNWKALLPYLVSKKLLDREISEILMSNYHTNLDKGLKYYLSVLPSKGNTAYSRFYSCIAQEEEHSGHRTLLELMNNFRK